MLRLWPKRQGIEYEQSTGKDLSGGKMPQAGDLPLVEEEIPRQRLRLIYEKGEPVKFISHQDEFRLWERTLRRADLPLLYKQGFNPQPHIVFASPLGVGITGVNEPIDITLSPSLPLEEVCERITAKLPPGVYLHDIAELPLKAPALQGLLIGADYTILLYAEPDELARTTIDAAIAQVLAQSEIWRERERKGESYTYNLRPLIFELRYQGYDAEKEEHRIFLRVQQRAGATGRPDEVVAALGLDNHARTLRRDRLYYADQPDDVAIFAAYPVIEQSAIAASKPMQRKGWRDQRRDSPEPRQRATSGRSISERAGDEFV
jgi:radical SAM-linked protein